MHRKPEFFSQPAEQRDVAGALVAEGEFSADAKALDPRQIFRQSANEHFAGLLAESFIEMNQQQRVRSERFNHAQLLRQRLNQWRHARRSHHGVGMTIERENQRRGFVLAGVSNGLPDDLLMSEVHAVEETDREADFPAGGGKFFGGADGVQGR